MKTFREQFVECEKSGLTKRREKIKPWMLPVCPSKARKILKLIKEGKLTHFEFYQCRFDKRKRCMSNNGICKELRSNLT